MFANILKYVFFAFNLLMAFAMYEGYSENAIWIRLTMLPHKPKRRELISGPRFGSIYAFSSLGNG